MRILWIFKEVWEGGQTAFDQSDKLLPCAQWEHGVLFCRVDVRPGGLLRVTAVSQQRQVLPGEYTSRLQMRVSLRVRGSHLQHGCERVHNSWTLSERRHLRQSIWCLQVGLKTRFPDLKSNWQRLSVLAEGRCVSWRKSKSVCVSSYHSSARSDLCPWSN